MSRLRWPRSFERASALPVDQMGALIEALIAEMDRRGGDPDLDRDDDADLSDFMNAKMGSRDDLGGSHTEDAEHAYTEWHTRGRYKVDRYGAEIVGANGSLHEDAEDDDPRESTAFEQKEYGHGRWNNGLADDDLEAEHDRCLAGDDGCGQFVANSRVYWGSEDEAGGHLMPKYGEDQSLGPINEREAAMNAQAAELGLVRTPTGWRRL